jgi:hypothetical protein
MAGPRVAERGTGLSFAMRAALRAPCTLGSTLSGAAAPVGTLFTVDALVLAVSSPRTTRAVAPPVALVENHRGALPQVTAFFLTRDRPTGPIGRTEPLRHLDTLETGPQP